MGEVQGKARHLPKNLLPMLNGVASGVSRQVSPKVGPLYETSSAEQSSFLAVSNMLQSDYPFKSTYPLGLCTLPPSGHGLWVVIGSHRFVFAPSTLGMVELWYPFAGSCNMTEGGQLISVRDDDGV